MNPTSNHVVGPSVLSVSSQNGNRVTYDAVLSEF